MAATLKVPTYFTAVDRFSSVVRNMGKSLSNFTKNTGSNFLRFNQRFNQFFKLSEAKKQLLSYASTATIVAGIVSGLVFSGKSMIDYEKNIASLHMILDDVSTKGFAKFQKQVDKVAKDLQYSSVDVAYSFAKIAELNYSLAETPESLAEVSKAAITLSRAAGIELTPATEGLVSILSQFNLKGKDANRVINVMAAGLKYGSANMQDQIDSYKNWGAVAKGANLTIEQSTALTQALAKYQLKGEEAGTALRGTIIRLQKAHLGYKSGLFNVNDALADASKHYAKLAKARDKDNYLIKLFGIRQIVAGRILLKETALINDLTQKVTGTNEASRQAAIATDTVAGAWQRLSAQFVNYMTSSAQGKHGMERLKDIMRWLADNMDRVLDTTISIVKWFAIFKVSMWAVAGAIKLFNFYNAASAAISTTAAAATTAQTVTVTGFGSAIAGVTTEMGAATTAATAFFATLSEFVIPAALVALGGLAIWKVLNHPKWQDGDTKDGPSMQAIDPKTKKINWFSNRNEEAAYQKWWLSESKKYKNYDTPALQREAFKPIWEKDHPSLFDFNGLKNFNKDNKPSLPALSPQNITVPTAKTDSTVHIYLHDSGGNVKDVKSSGSGKIDIKITPTNGQR